MAGAAARRTSSRARRQATATPRSTTTTSSTRSTALPCSTTRRAAGGDRAAARPRGKARPAAKKAGCTWPTSAMRPATRSTCSACWRIRNSPSRRRTGSPASSTATGASEPATKEDEEIANKIYSYHQGYGLSGAPAPLLIQNGWTDDLFPPKEALRVYNAAKGKVTLQIGDLGHSRGSNKENTDHAFQEQGASFFAARLQRLVSPP